MYAARGVWHPARLGPGDLIKQNQLLADGIATNSQCVGAGATPKAGFDSISCSVATGTCDALTCCDTPTPDPTLYRDPQCDPNLYGFVSFEDVCI
jgi:hypothetical protein